MRPVVAIVATRPETVAEDYRRLLDLAGFAPDPDGRGQLVAAQAQGRGWLSGSGCPPWQLDAVLERLSPDGGGNLLVGAVERGPGLRRADLRSWGWDEVLARHGLPAEALPAAEPVRVHAQQPLPSLTAAMPGGPAVPAPLIGRGLVLLAVPALRPAWPIAGAVALLRHLILGPLPRLARIPVAEVTAEVVGLARDVCGPLPAVLDAVIWDTSAVSGDAGVTARHVLLASSDAVALDAVVVRLAGGDPLRIPWLQLCRQRGLGAVADDEIRLAGQTELLSLDFGLRRAAFSGDLSGRLRLPGWPGGPLLRRRDRRRRDRQDLAAGPWGQLFAAYRQGTVHENPTTESS